MADGKAVLKSKKAIAGYVALLLGNSPFWTVVGRAGDVDFLIQTGGKIWPAVVAAGLFLRDWGWTAGMAWLALLWFRPERPAKVMVTGTERQRVDEGVSRKLRVTVFRHAAANDPQLETELSRFFLDAGWEVEKGYTELPQHAEGVFVKGPSTTAHAILTWALREFGVDSRVDGAQDHGGGWQVIIGAGAERIRRRESILEELQNTRRERDDFSRDLSQLKTDWALEHIRMYSGMRFDGIAPTVTVRFAAYGGDYALARNVEKILKEAGWNVTVDGTNNPVLPQAENAKVVFEVTRHTLSFDPLIVAFDEGNLLGVPVGKTVSERSDFTHLIVKVLPSGV